VQDFERIVAQKPCILTGDRSYFFSQPIINGKGFKNIIAKSADKSKQNFADNC